MAHGRRTPTVSAAVERQLTRVAVAIPSLGTMGSLWCFLEKHCSLHLFRLLNAHHLQQGRRYIG